MQEEARQTHTTAFVQNRTRHGIITELLSIGGTNLQPCKNSVESLVTNAGDLAAVGARGGAANTYNCLIRLLQNRTRRSTITKLLLIVGTNLQPCKNPVHNVVTNGGDLAAVGAGRGAGSPWTPNPKL